MSDPRKEIPVPRNPRAPEWAWHINSALVLLLVGTIVWAWALSEQVLYYKQLYGFYVTSYHQVRTEAELNGCVRPIQTDGSLLLLKE